MRYTFLFIAICLCLSSFAQEKKENKPKTFKLPPPPGEKDSMTMKQYYFVMLVKGRDRDKIKDTAVINKLQAGHMANMDRLANEGKLLVAGPFGDDGNWRGIFILDCNSKEEAEALLATDPAIKAGRLDYELHPWWTAMNGVFK
ncbi:MAG: hypothetical protein K0Q79_3386 [Flavipsychrobacter sp.]|jgi:uncharacterized protein YciI|nr:hypothetical protein [Flavipsychrobacter sp.]